jgi:hypothetical protein
VNYTRFGPAAADQCSCDCCGHDSTGVSRVSVALYYDYRAEP